MRTHTYSDITYDLSDHALLCTHVPLTCPDLVRSDFSIYSLDADVDRRIDATSPHTTPEADPTQPGPDSLPHGTPQTPPASKGKRYIWIGGEDTIEYMRNVDKWKAHTSSETFATTFQQITEEFKDQNELRTERVEEFLVREAIEAGVVKAIDIRP